MGACNAYSWCVPRTLWLVLMECCNLAEVKAYVHSGDSSVEFACLFCITDAQLPLQQFITTQMCATVHDNEK